MPRVASHALYTLRLMRKRCTAALPLTASIHGTQVPCGIFDDPKLVAELKEACETIKKAQTQVTPRRDTSEALPDEAPTHTCRQLL